MLGGGTPEDVGCCHAGIFVAAPNNVVRGNVVGGSAAHDQDPGIRSTDGAVGQAPSLIEDNFVGTNAAGTAVFGNGIGIGLYGDKTGTVVRRNVVAHSVTAGIWLVEGTQFALIGGAAGTGNTIRNNGAGILIGYNAGDPDTGNTLRSNVIYGNTNLGIDLGSNGVTANDVGDVDAGPNRLMNFPALSNVNTGGAATTVEMLLDTETPNSNYEIQVFAGTACHASGFGQGERLVGTFARTSDGAADIASTLMLTEAVPVGQFLTATATDTTGNTSEFSQCVQVPAPPAPQGPGAPDGSAGGTGGTPFGPIVCPAGTVGAGLRGGVGDDIDRTHFYCRTVLAGPALGGEVFAGGVGGPGGTDYGNTLMCPAGSAMIGVHGRAGQVLWGGNVVDTLGTICRDVVTSAVTQTATVGNPAPLASPFSLMCPAGEEVIAIGGGQGGLLDRIEIYCGNPVPPEPVAQVTIASSAHARDGYHARRRPPFIVPSHRALGSEGLVVQ